MFFGSALLRRLLVTGSLFASVLTSHAMSVIAPSFDELVNSADFVVRGVVTDIQYVASDTPQGQAIHTLVTFHVEHVLKGNPDPDVTLSFLGGKVGRHTLSVVGMPKFAVGEREIVFVARNGQVICPLVAAGHGRYRVRHDATSNRDFVARDNNAPLTSTAEIAQPLDEAAGHRAALSPAAALTPDAFEQRVSDVVRHGHSTLLP